MTCFQRLLYKANEVDDVLKYPTTLNKRVECFSR